MCQEGSLIRLFETDNENVDINEYETSIYLRKIENINHKLKVINAYENFKRYIMDDKETIDYKYIWDLICKPINQGGVLFENGINLLIFRNPDNDILNKIELICPSSNNSEEFFDEEKNTYGL